MAKIFDRFTRLALAAFAAGMIGLAPAYAQSMPVRPRPPQQQRAQYDATQLHADVRRAVLAARAIEARAVTAAARARTAAVQGEDAARRARAGQSGYRAYSANDFLFEVQIQNNLRQGHGVSVDQSADYYGDRYSGTWANDQFSGVGVLVFGQNPNNRSGVERYEGEYATDQRNGVGILFFRDGSRYAGIYSQNRRNQGGVYHYPDGRRYEGEYNGGPTDRPNGHGVVWTAYGRVQEAGIWRDGQLVTPLAR